ncbi:MAG: low molecular weight phosphotyrosine protein phosphatase [Anaerolineae bacterium]|nr:low molecular weight phosphotyrosine protein phosphatase [Anaerolineae bacterium]MDW8173857.1 low molecular weight protein-tyrosine-phosphatase [Anaerolineae bacterium]
MIRVLIVCLGNICRSPMAENVLRHLVAEAGLSAQISVDSAGTANYHVGELAHKRTRGLLADHAIPYSGTARQLTKDDLASFDYVLAMDADNLTDVQRLRSAHTRAKIGLFLDDAYQASLVDVRYVPDPYYTDRYEETFELVMKGSRAFLERLRRDHQL